MSFNSGLASLALTTGVAAMIGGATAWKIQSEFRKIEESKRKNLSEVVHLISIKDIGELLDSDNLEVQQAAERLLKQRAVSWQYFQAVLQSCLSDDKETTLKAATSVFLLCKSSNDNKLSNFKEVALSTLLKLMEKLSDGYNYKALISKCKADVVTEKTFFNCVGAIFHLTFNDSALTRTLYKEKCCLRDIFLHILSDHGFHILTEVKRWSTYIIHQLVQGDVSDVRKSMRKWSIITKTTLCLIRTIGDLLLTQLCLQILVYYLNDSVDEIVRVCQEIAALGVLPHLVGLLRCEEEENIVQWSGIIIHHFCCFDIDVRNLSKIPGIVKILLSVLNSNEATIQKTVLRIINYLCISSNLFQKNLLNEKPLLKRLSVCLASGNKEVVHGSLMLLHDLAMPGKHAAQKLIVANPDILKSLVTLALPSTGEQAQLIAETLGFFCSCESLHSVLLKQGVINAILHFTKSADTSVQFWASALLLNLAMISDEIKEAIIRNGGIFILLEMAISGDEVEMPDIASNAAKALVILGFLDSVIEVQMQAGMDGSIIIDGTEYCPGKQGINLVSLDFINFKYSKGLVLQPGSFEKHMLDNHVHSTKKWDPLFVVTQGECTLGDTGQNAQTYEELVPHTQMNDFLRSPVWTMIISAKETRVCTSTENLSKTYHIPLKDCLNYVLKDNFTDPLVDVLLSYPPSSTTNKSEDLDLIEILSRHSFQRREIIKTTGFLEYLNEMIWDIISLKIECMQDPENSNKLAHCISALKILHAFSIDKATISELVNRGVPRVILSLLVSIIKFARGTHTRDAFTFNREESIFESEEKEYSTSDQKHVVFDDDHVLPASIASNINFDHVTASNDSIFYEEDEDKDKTVLSTISERSDGDSTSTPITRRRADSYIVRADTRSRQRSESRQSFLDRSISIDQQPTSQVAQESSVLTSPYTPSRRALNMDEMANHQQMRRISRSMSISLQNTKSAVGDEFLNEILPDTDEVIKKMTKHSIMAIFHMVMKADSQTLEQLHSMHFVVILQSVLSCFDDNFKSMIGLPISTVLMKCGRSLNKNSDCSSKINAATVEHVSAPNSLILSTNKLQVANENWYFESVRGNQHVSTSLYDQTSEAVPGWYYEVVIHTKGIIQIGWANEGCVFDPHKGVGVGDTTNSCGFDGIRCKIWYGPSIDVFEDNDYGIAWQIGDVVSVLLSWKGDISFWLNGKDLGVARRGVDTSKLWYPAASLSVDQQCSFIFKSSDMKYKKCDYVALDDVHQQFGRSKQITERMFNNDAKQVNIIRETKVFSGVAATPVYFFEVDISCIEDIRTISIGFIHRKTSTQHEEKSKNKSAGTEKRVEQSTGSEESDSKLVCTDMIKKMDTGFLKDLQKKGGTTLGCGIVSLSKHLIITLGTQIIWQSSISEILEGDREWSDNMYLDLFPFVSVENVYVNVGQKCFVYDQANTTRCKQTLIKLVLDSIDREEND